MHMLNRVGFITDMILITMLCADISIELQEVSITATMGKMPKHIMSEVSLH